jgi:hypothetical protein
VKKKEDRIPKRYQNISQNEKILERPLEVNGGFCYLISIIGPNRSNTGKDDIQKLHTYRLTVSQSKDLHKGMETYKCNTKFFPEFYDIYLPPTASILERPARTIKVIMQLTYICDNVL